MICSALGEGAVIHKTCKERYQRFRSGDFDLSERERPGQPKKFEDEKLWAVVEWKLRSNSAGARTATWSYPSMHFHALTSAAKDSEGGYRWIPHELARKTKSEGSTRPCPCRPGLKERIFCTKLLRVMKNGCCMTTLKGYKGRGVLWVVGSQPDCYCRALPTATHPFERMHWSKRDLILVRELG